jgi:hypothetical protein
MNRKKVTIFVALILASILISSFVLAQADVGTGVQSALDTFTSAVNPIIKFIVGPAETTDLLLVKFLFLILIFGVAYYAAGFTPGIRDSTFFMVLIAAVISLLATRFLTSPELINLIWLPSGTAGIAFATLLPFVLYFFLIERLDNPIIRRVGWVVFIVLYFGLAIYRWNDLAAGTEWWNNLGWWYLAIGVISLLVLVFDKKIRAMYIMSEIEAHGADLDSLKLAKVQKDRNDAKDIISNPSSTPPQVEAARRVIKDLDKKMRAILSS